MLEKKQLLEKIKELQERTGLSIQVCKQALDQSEYDMDKSVMWLKNNQKIQSLSLKEILDKCSSYADEWAIYFLDTTSESRELQVSYESNKLDVIQENFFSWHIAGIPDICPYLLFKENLKTLTKEEKSEFDEKIKELYDNAVQLLLPEYIQSDWKSPK